MRKTAQQPAQAQTVQVPAQPAAQQATAPMSLEAMQAMLMQFMQQAPAPAVQAAPPAKSAGGGEKEAMDLLSKATFVEVRFTEKGKPYAVIQLPSTGGKRASGQRLTVWLAE